MRRALILVVLPLALLAAGPGGLQAQDDWGLTRDPEPARTRRPRAGGARRTGTTRPSAPAGREEGAGRTDALIERYLQIGLSDPSSSFALDRLVELHTQRDGHTDSLLAALQARASQEDPEAHARTLLGHLYLRLGRGADAEAAFTAASAAAPREVAPRVALAALRHEAGDIAGARALLAAALELATRGAAREDILRTLGRYALDAGDVEGARAHFGDLARSAGGGVGARSEYARALSERGDHAAAAAAYADLTTGLAGDRRALGPLLLALGREALEAGDVAQAIDALERARRSASGGARAEVLSLVVEAHRRGDRLAELTDRMATQRAAAFEDLIVLGSLEDELGRDADALATYRRALRLRPRDAEARLRVTQLLARGGRLDELVSEYRVLVRDHPSEPRFLMELATILADAGRRGDALGLLDARARRSRDARMHSMLAGLFAGWGEQERAARALEQVARLEPNDPAHLVALGDQHLSAGRRAEALAVWRRLLTLDQGAQGHELLGSVLADHDLLAEAVPEFELALQAEPERASAMRLLATTLERAGRPHEAEAMWQRAYAAAPPDDPARREARERIVALWFSTDRATQEGARLARAFAVDPPDFEAGQFLAELARRRRAPDEALAVLRRLLSVDPREVEILRALLRVLEQAGRRADALPILETLVEVEPRHASAHLARMAEHALALYRDEDAVRYATRAVERRPDDAPAHRRLGDLHRARQEPEAARASYRRALVIDPDLHETALALAELELAAGRSRDADELFARIIRESADDDLVARATGASLHLHVGAGDVEALEAVLLPVVLAHPERPLYRRLLIEVYDLMLAPSLAQVRAQGPTARQAHDRIERYASRGLKPLLEALAASDPAQRRVALSILSEASLPGAAPALLSVALSEADTETRIQAALAAAQHATPAFASRFATLAERPEPMLAVAGLIGLARARGRAAVPVLRAALTSRETSTRAYAAVALGYLRDGSSVAALIELLGDVSAEVRAGAALGLAWSQSAAAAPPLRRLAQSSDDASVAALLALGSSSDPSARALLLQVAIGGDRRAREVAAVALRSGGPARPDALPAPRPRETPLAYVMRVARPAELAPLDLAPLQDSVLSVIQEGLAQGGSAALAVLTRLEAPPGPIGLGELCADADELAPLAGDATRGILSELARALTPDLTRAAQDPDASIRASATRVLSRIEGEASHASLLAALQDPAETVVRAALDGLALHAREDSAGPVGAILAAHSSWSIRMAAARVLGRIDSSESVETLQLALEADRFAFVRSAAADALGELARASSRDALERAAASDVEPQVRASAVRALAAVDSAAVDSAAVDRAAGGRDAAPRTTELTP